jgi:AcrR family transcriptional regulator
MSTQRTSSRPYRMVRRLEQSEATAARLVDAAWERFSTQPYESVRLSDVAADARVTVQTLHARFGTKEGLFTAAFRRWMAQQGEQRVVARVGDVDDVVRVLYDNYDDQGAIGLRMIAQEDRIDAIHADLDRGRRWQRAWVADVLGPFLDAAPPDGRADLHEALIVALDIYTWRLLRLDIGHPTEDARRIVAGMINALARAPAARRSRRR